MKTKDSWKKYFGLLFLGLAVAFSTGCSKKKDNPLFWLLLGAGGGSKAGSGLDANGVPLPDNLGNNAPEGVIPTSGAIQEVPTSGPAQINGSFLVMSNGNPADDVCGMPSAPPPPNCVDLTAIIAYLVAPNGTIVAQTNLNADGEFQFNIDDLPNNNYRVLIETGLGLNYAYDDFNFTYDPTSSGGVTVVNLLPIETERLYLNGGPAVITGSVGTPGFNDGSTIVPSGNRSGVVVNLRNPSNGNAIIATTTTDASGNYTFNLSNLSNGNYAIEVLGSGLTESGRPFTDITREFRFTFQGNDPSIATNVSLGRTDILWDAATSSNLVVSGTLTNAGVVDTTTVYTIRLVSPSGAVLDTTTITGSGAYSLSASNLTAGVYTVQAFAGSASNPTTFPASSTVVFTPNPTGGTRTITGIGVSIVSKPSEVVGFVTDGILNYVPGSVINFRPAASQPPVNLLYLLNDDILRNLIILWLSESNAAVAGNCVATGNLTPACVLANQGTGPWNYSTYSNKVYEVRPDNSVYFTAVSGTWAYYISAPGYNNYCGSNTNCPVNPLVLTLNGQNYDAGTITLTPSSNRSQIAGNIVVPDRLLVNGTRTGQVVATATNHTNFSNLMVVLLGNSDNSGNPVAHVTATNNGSYSFGGLNSFVVPLPSSLTTDSARVQHALTEVGKLAASLPSTAKALADPTNNVIGGATASVHVVSGTQFNFRQSSYQVIVVDPLGHTVNASFAVNNTSTATATYTTTPVTHSQTNTVPHLPRRQIVGNIFNAISAAGLGTATVLIGRPGPNNEFIADVRRDCNTGMSNNYICGISNDRTHNAVPQNDQTLVGPTTEPNGDFMINNINPGNYILRITAPGFQDMDIPVTVNSTGPIPNIQVALVPNTGSGHLAGSVRLPGGHPFTGTYNLELVHPTSGNRPPASCGINPVSLTTGFTTFTNAPTYNIFSVCAGQWKIRFVSAGYKTVEGIVNIQANTTTHFDIITMVPGSDPPASIVGRAINAITNNASGMAGLTVRLRPGVNVTSGPFATFQDGVTTIPAVTTASNGSFAINNVPAGNYTLEVSGPNVATTYRTVISAGSATPASQDILVSPKLGSDEVRIILSWNARPRDLDSHLEFEIKINNDPEVVVSDQVVWNDKIKLNGDAVLDVDVVTGFGPETITLKGSAWSQQVKRRGYSVFNWSFECLNSSCTQRAQLSQSGAVVRVFNSNGLVRSYAVPTNITGRWWQIFCLTPTKSIVDVGTSSYCQASQFFNKPQN